MTHSPFISARFSAMSSECLAPFFGRLSSVAPSRHDLIAKPHLIRTGTAVLQPDMLNFRALSGVSHSSLCRSTSIRGRFVAVAVYSDVPSKKLQARCSGSNLNGKFPDKLSTYVGNSTLTRCWLKEKPVMRVRISLFSGPTLT